MCITNLGPFSSKNELLLLINIVSTNQEMQPFIPPSILEKTGNSNKKMTNFFLCVIFPSVLFIRTPPRHRLQNAQHNV